MLTVASPLFPEAFYAVVRTVVPPVFFLLLRGECFSRRTLTLLLLLFLSSLPLLEGKPLAAIRPPFPVLLLLLFAVFSAMGKSSADPHAYYIPLPFGCVMIRRCSLEQRCQQKPGVRKRHDHHRQRGSRIRPIHV